MAWVFPYIDSYTTSALITVSSSSVVSEVRIDMEGPLALGCVQPTAGDRERLDDQPRVAFGEHPRLGVEPLTKRRRVCVDVVQGAAHEHRPAFEMGGVE